MDTPISDEALITMLVGGSLVLQSYSGDGRSQKTYAPVRPKDVRLAVGGFSSPHPGGTQFAFGDGSIHFFSGTTNFDVLFNLANRADGALMDGDF
jgi:prepilin-type processing-associated H-X9-DG protein